MAVGDEGFRISYGWIVGLGSGPVKVKEVLGSSWRLSDALLMMERVVWL